MGVFAAAITVYALNQEGYQTHRASLNDGSVWVSNPRVGLGNENRPLGQLDSVAPLPCGATCGQVDVVQEGSAVFAVSNSALTPVDVAQSVAPANGQIGIPSNTTVGLGGSTLATLDRSGNLRVASVDSSTTSSDLTTTMGAGAKPIKFGSNGLLTVGTDGVAYVASGASLTRVTASGSGFSKSSPSTLSTAAAPFPGDTTGAITVVGQTLAYATSPNGSAFSVDGHQIGVDPGSVLQQPSDTADSVLLGTDQGLDAVASGKLTRLVPATGIPSQPVRLGDCAYGAWYAPSGGTVGMVASSCDGAVVTGTVITASPGHNCLPDQAASPLRLRSNHGQVVLNDICTGDVWPVGKGAIHAISDWMQVTKTLRPQQSSKNTIPDTHPKVKAHDDDAGVRVGSQAVIHVLDNDQSDPKHLLEISGVSTASPAPGVTIVETPDHQTLLATADDTASTGVVHFRYSIDDGSSSDSATVNLTVRSSTNPAAAPRLRHGGPIPTYSVAAGGTVNIPVSDAYRDPINGDQIAVYGPDSRGVGQATVSPEGMLSFSARNVSPGTQVSVQYGVGTANTPSATFRSSVQVNVVGGQDAVGPILEPDVVSGVIADPTKPAVITIHPLANDVPGADPSDPNASIALTGVTAVEGADSATPDSNAGTIQVTASHPGNYTYTYTARYGSAQSAKPGMIRVIVTSKASPQPVALPDQTTLYGTQGKTVDVLANDFDPQGRVLVLQDATPDPNSGLQAAIIDNRWLRLVETNPGKTGTYQVAYDMNAGSGPSARGIVSVSLQPDNPLEDTPVTAADHAVVRAGDSVTVPVLDNDSIPSGASLALVEPGHTCTPGPCGLTVLSADGSTLVGTAAIAGNSIRYVAPLGINSPVTVQVPYTAMNQTMPGKRDSNTLWIQINPLPASRAQDQAPTPVAIQAQAISGDTITIHVPGVGMDPDGDSVSIVGIGDPTSTDPSATVPTLGTVLAHDGNSITYQAFPGLAGTDTFKYVVADAYGKTGVGTIQVGVVAPGAAQPPLPVDDLVTVDPGKELRYPVTANDIHEPGQAVTLAPLPQNINGVTADISSGTIIVAPGSNAGPNIPYQLVGPTGLTGYGYLRITYTHPFDNPPVAGPVTAKPGANATSVTVDLGKYISDIDDTSLRIDQVQNGLGATAPINRTSVTLPVNPTAPVVWSYRVTDPSGAAALGTIYVPARSAGGPYWNGTTIQMKPNANFTMDASKYVSDSAGKKVLLGNQGTYAEAPAGNLSFVRSTATTLTIHAGPAAGVGSLSFAATDASTANGADGTQAMITVPVIIGDPKPVLSCPDAPVVVVDQGDTVPVNVSQYCHTWTAVPGQAANLTYSTSTAMRGLHASGGTPTISFSATGAFTSNCKDHRAQTSSGQVTVATGGISAQIQVKIICAPPATFIAPPPFSTTTKKGAITIDLSHALKSPLAHQKIVVVGDPRAANTPTSGSWTFTPGTAVGRFTPGTDGHFLFNVDMNDSNGASDRTVTGQIEIDVAGVPTAPLHLQWKHAVPADLVSNSAYLMWDAPTSDGHDPNGISGYTVTIDNGRTFPCPASPCHVLGLNNNQPYSFTVSAINSVGTGPQSSPIKNVVPNTMIGSVNSPKGGFLTTESASGFTVSWAPPTCVSTGKCKIDGYQLSTDAAGKNVFATPTGLSAFVSASTGADKTIYISPVDKQLQSAVGFPVTNTTAVTARAASKPDSPQITITEQTAADNSKELVLSWPQVNANGPTPVTYAVTASPAGSPPCVMASTTAQSCTISANTDGTQHDYSVTATNDGPNRGTAPQAPSAYTSKPTTVHVKFTTAPGPVTLNYAHGTGNNNEAAVSVTYGAAGDASGTMHCRMDGATCPGYPDQTVNRGGGTIVTTLKGWSNGAHQVVFYETNSGGGTGSNGSVDSNTSTSATEAFDVFGAIGHGTLTASTSGQNVSWNVDGAGVDPNGRPVDWTVTVTNVNNANDTHSWSGSTGTGQTGAFGNSAQMSYSSTYSVTLTITDTNNGAGGPDATAPIRATVPVPAANGNAVTGNPPPTAPALTGYIVVVGGSCGNGPSCTGRIGISWTTTYSPTPTSDTGGQCHWSIDGAETLATPLGCGFDGKASHQFYNQPLGVHTYCGWVQMPDGSKSNIPCQSVTVK